MLTLQIQNPEIENIFAEGFQGNKEKFLAFIQRSYEQRTSLAMYEADKERFMQTYKGMKEGSMKMFSELEAKQEIDTFLETL